MSKHKIIATELPHQFGKQGICQDRVAEEASRQSFTEFLVDKAIAKLRSTS